MIFLLIARVSYLNLFPLFAVRKQSPLKLSTLVLQASKTRHLMETNKTKTKLIGYKKDQFILHFKSITWKRSLIYNALFIIGFQDQNIKNIQKVLCTSKFSDTAHYHVHYNQLFIFHFNARSRAFVVFLLSAQQSIEQVDLKKKTIRKWNLNFLFRIKPTFVSLNQQYFLLFGFKPSVGKYSVFFHIILL